MSKVSDLPDAATVDREQIPDHQMKRENAQSRKKVRTTSETAIGHAFLLTTRNDQSWGVKRSTYKGISYERQSYPIA